MLNGFKRFAILFVLSFFVLISINAQERPSDYPNLEGVPEYIKLIHDHKPNVFEVEKAFRSELANSEFEKNTHSLYYKRWMHWARTQLDNDGFVKEREISDLNREEQIRKGLRNNSHFKFRKSPADWKFIGPSKTYHTDGITKVTWQTNIYSMDVCQSNPNILFAGGESGGLWKSIDKGLNWNLCTADILHGAFTAVSVHPVYPDTVFAATSGKIIRSTDGGKNWSTVYSENGMTTHDLMICSGKSHVILAAGNKGLKRSGDGGQNWYSGSADEVWTLQQNVSNPNILYAITKIGNSTEFLRSSDYGSIWLTRGSNWYKPNNDVTVTGALLAVCPSNPQKLYAYLCGSGGTIGGYIGVFVSNDGGFNWSNTNPLNTVGGPYSMPDRTNLMAHNGTDGFNQGFYDMAIVVNPSNDMELIAGGTSWFKSTDGGASWNPLGGYVGNLPWSHPDIQCLVAIGNDLWIGSDGGINYSTNFAQSIEARMDGVSGADLWGFDGGWNEDLLVGGRYHNGNMAWHQSFPANSFFRMGGAESPTGYVNPGPGRKTYFSDIGGYSIHGGLDGGVSRFPVGLFPNESYAYYANSQMVWHPHCWNIIYLGRDNKLWKSTNGGSGFELLYSFPGNEDNKVYEIEISRSNPQVLYCSQWDGTDDSMWRSEDGGISWIKLTALPLPNNNDRVKMSLSAVDENVLWVAVSYGSNGKKIYKTTDGGKSWENLTTPVLDNVRISDVMHAMGTDGGIYLGTNRGVYYRNNLMNDWEPFSTGLPVSAETNRLKPFYKDGKLRNGCWGFGVWETSLFEEFETLPKIMADKLQSKCLRDTFYFDDHSVCLHENTSWSWELEGVAYTSGTDTRTPLAVYDSPGKKRVIMNLKTQKGNYKDSLWIEIEDHCSKDSLPNLALKLDGNKSYLLTPVKKTLTNKLSWMAWVKSTAVQNDWAGIMFFRNGGEAAGLSVLANGDLRYHWKSSGYNWVSGAKLEQNEWTHLALVVSPDSLIIYKNGRAFVRRQAHGEQDFSGSLAIGADLNGGARFFNGLIDEVCIYDRSLSQEEIREQMHLTRTHTATEGLQSYFQFKDSDTYWLDLVGNEHASSNGSVALIPSTAPVGPGTSQRMDVNSSGIFEFQNTGATIELGSGNTYPEGELCISRINHIPAQNFNPINKPTGNSYWIIHNYGKNASFDDLKSIQFSNVGPLSAFTNTKEYQLFMREANADTSSWEFKAFASDKTESELVFEPTGIDSEGQFIFTKTEGDTIIVSIENPVVEKMSPWISIYPNPSLNNSDITFYTSLQGKIHCSIYAIGGKKVMTFSFEKEINQSIQSLKPGMYYCIFENKDQLIIKNLLISR